MIRQGRRCFDSDWALETRVIRPGVVTARNLLDGDCVDVVARVCNYSDMPYVFEQDSFLGLAEPVDTGIEPADRGETSTQVTPADVAVQSMSVHWDIPAAQDVNNAAAAAAAPSVDTVAAHSTNATQPATNTPVDVAGKKNSSRINSSACRKTSVAVSQ